ncbi:TPA: ead/Ea22-like family protein [Klebsiella oxytoca]|uniref:Ead/Ea22-like family protein n=1 Tax=Klebsiella oxytoca TaxID=571 RepID=A0AAN5LBV7_KLEOX|nr:ead/Ea22-like family protein [Klebsiella oxytoca]
MTALNKQALLKIAESVDREEWDVLDNGDDEYQVIVSGSLERGATYRSYRPVANEISDQKIAAFIAAFNPTTILALLDELEAAEKHIAELEARTYIPQPLNIEDEYQNYEYVAGWNDCCNATACLFERIDRAAMLAAAPKPEADQ